MATYPIIYDEDGTAHVNGYTIKPTPSQSASINQVENDDPAGWLGYLIAYRNDGPAGVCAFDATYAADIGYTC